MKKVKQMENTVHSIQMDKILIIGDTEKQKQNREQGEH